MHCGGFLMVVHPSHFRRSMTIDHCRLTLPCPLPRSPTAAHDSASFPTAGKAVAAPVPMSALTNVRLEIADGLGRARSADVAWWPSFVMFRSPHVACQSDGQGGSPALPARGRGR